MPIAVISEFRCASRRQGGFTALYAALLLFSLHWAIVLYVNSSYLEQFVSHEIISGLYILGAVCTIVAFLHATPLLNRFGNTRLAIALTSIEFCTLLGMAYSYSIPLSMVLFVVHQAIVPLILFSLDIYMEELIGDKEGSTGSKRGLLLTIMSITGVLASLSMGKLMGSDTPHFSLVYIVSALILVPFLYLIYKYFRGFCDPRYPHFKIAYGIQHFWKTKDIRNVFFAHFLLQIFFAWMVIYTPIYLARHIGFNWELIGIILSIGLTAYVFLEWVIGYIADNFVGEKEMMALGFTIIGISTSWFIFLDDTSLRAWIIAMFMTRVGASFVETTTESYFFKHTQGKDTSIIGIFRVTRPLSYVIGAILGSITLYILPFELLFIVLGLLMIPGLFFTMALHDTK